MNHPLYKHWSEIKYLKDLVTNPLIEVGEYSYYSGYYGDQNFEDGCVRYLWGDLKAIRAILCIQRGYSHQK